MDEDTDELMRSLVSKQAALHFILEYLLNAHMLSLPRHQRLQIAESILDASVQTEFLSGLTKGDDHASERMADMIVRFQQQVDELIGQALQKTAQVEDARLARLGEQALKNAEGQDED